MTSLKVCPAHRLFRSVETRCWSRRTFHINSNALMRQHVRSLQPAFRADSASSPRRNITATHSQQAKASLTEETHDNSKNNNNHFTVLEVSGQHGRETFRIQRSYPKGKPEKLIAGLQRLLASVEGMRDSRPNKPRWRLSDSGDAIHRILVLPGQAQVDQLTTAIDRASDAVGHHPHYSYRDHPQQQCKIAVVTCTTHVPHGLSLKDVKLADQLNEAINGILHESSDSVPPPPPLEGTAEGIAESLVRQNEDAARVARGNPDSICQKAG